VGAGNLHVGLEVWTKIWGLTLSSKGVPWDALGKGVASDLAHPGCCVGDEKDVS
jgi:hypothetical protein